MLKNLWDAISLVIGVHQEWRSTKWSLCDVNAMIAASQDLHKHVLSMDFRVKSWPAYEGLEQMLKNMAIALPLVQELQDQAMRSRHWKLLMRTSGKHTRRASTSCTSCDRSNSSSGSRSAKDFKSPGQSCSKTQRK